MGNQELNQVKPAESNAFSSNNGGITIDPGPAAPIALILTEELSMYMDLMNKNNQFSVDEIKVQGKMGQSSAGFTEYAAQMQSMSTYMSAAGSLFGAFVTFGQALSTSGSFGKLNELETKNSDIEKEMIPLNTLKKQAAITPTQKPITMSDPNALVAEDLPLPPVVTARMEELKSDNYEGGTAYKAAAKPEELDKAAIAELQKDELAFKEFKNRLDSKYSDMVKDRNTTVTEIQDKRTRFQTFGQIAQSVGTGGFQSGSAVYTAKAGTGQSGQTLANTIAGQAGETSNRTKAQTDQYFNKVAELVQLLQRAASAYPQG